MTREEWLLLNQPEHFTSKGKVILKLEIAKLWNLLPGTLACYARSCELSAFGEASLIASMGTRPLVWSEEHRTRHMRAMRRVALLHHIGCRDFKNYNICYRHSDMQAFCLACGERVLLLGDTDMAEAAQICSACLSNVGVEHLGRFYRWSSGLISGWRHTMLFHCISNPRLGSVASHIVESWVPDAMTVTRAHQGDDAAEVSNRSWIGPALLSEWLTRRRANHHHGRVFLHCSDSHISWKG